MKELEQFVEQENRWSAIFGGPKLDLRQASDRQLIASSIDAALSPENLTCDGELPASQVRAKHANLVKVARELQAFDPEAAKAIYELSF